jgi:hypothetical protein
MGCQHTKPYRRPRSRIQDGTDVGPRVRSCRYANFNVWRGEPERPTSEEHWLREVRIGWPVTFCGDRSIGQVGGAVGRPSGAASQQLDTRSG